MRVAWFTPLPPVRSGIAAYSVEVLPLLASQLELDVFVDAEATTPRDRPPTSAGLAAQAASLTGVPVAVRSAHEFVHRHALRPYDLVVYQLGNAECHDYVWPYALRYPGLVVLHDAQLHHGRARLLLSRARRDDYRAEFRWNHPDVGPNAAEFAVAGLPGSPYYLWPMLGLVVRTARAVAAHSAVLAADLRAEFPDVPVLHVPMGVRAAAPVAAAPVGTVPNDPVATGGLSQRFAPDGRSADTGRGGDCPRSDRRADSRSTTHGEVRFAAFGLVTPEKRIAEILRVFARVTRVVPNATLRLVGDRAAHYDVDAAIATTGLASHVTLTGYVPDAALDDEYAAADVCLCLRWPTGRETSASWLRALAAGRPTVVSDLVHTGDVPALDPRDWLIRCSATAGLTRDAAVAITIDLMDEGHSLELAMTRLATDAALRRRLGERARAWWRAHHTLEAMAAAYLAAIDDTAARPAPTPPALPPHVRADGSDTLTRILGEVGVGTDRLTDRPVVGAHGPASSPRGPSSPW